MQQRHHALADDWAATLRRALQVRQQHRKLYGTHECRIVKLGPRLIAWMTSPLGTAG